MRNGHVKVKANAAWALAYLAGHNADNKVGIARAGAVQPLVQLLRSEDEKGEANAAHALANRAADNEDNKVGIARAGAVKPLNCVVDKC